MLKPLISSQREQGVVYSGRILREQRLRLIPNYVPMYKLFHKNAIDFVEQRKA